MKEFSTYINKRKVGIMLSMALLVSVQTARPMWHSVAGAAVRFAGKAFVSAVITGAICLPFFMKTDEAKNLKNTIRELPWQKLLSLATLSGICNAVFFSVLSGKSTQEPLHQRPTSPVIPSSSTSTACTSQAQDPALLQRMTNMLARLQTLENGLGELKKDEGQHLDDWFAEKAGTIQYLQVLYRELLGDKTVRRAELTSEAPVPEAIREAATFIGNHISVVAKECIGKTMHEEKARLVQQRKEIEQQNKVRFERIEERFLQIEQQVRSLRNK